MSKPSKKKPSEKSKQSELSVINPHAAGIDLGSREHWACVPSSSTESTNIQANGSTTPDLIAKEIGSPQVGLLLLQWNPLG